MGWGKNLYDLVRIPIKKVCDIYYLRWYYSGWHYWAFLPGKYTVVTEGEKYRTIGTRKIAMGSGQITRGQSNAIRTIMNTREVYLLTIAGWMNIRIEPGTINVYESQVAGNEIEFVAVIGSKEITYSTGFSPVGAVPVVIPSITYCEVIIGNQIWMCKNWDANYPGSKVYNDDEANRAIYGGLYSYNQIKSPGFCPAGWHIPTNAEWVILSNFLGINAGGHLKEAGLTHWNAPNTGAVDTYGFSALGGGYCIVITPPFGTPFITFNGLLESGNFWTDTTFGFYYSMKYDNDSLNGNFASITNNYLSVRLIKDTPYSQPLTEITIGTQKWANKNIDVNLVGSRVYNDDEANRPIYGGLYPWAMIPQIEALYPGWHVPSQAEWDTLEAYLNGLGQTGATLKEVGLAHWFAPNLGATDLYGFTALPGGYWDHILGPGYHNLGEYGFFWTTDEFDADEARYRGLAYDITGVIGHGGTEFKLECFSIRLIHD